MGKIRKITVIFQEGQKKALYCWVVSQSWTISCEKFCLLSSKDCYLVETFNLFPKLFNFSPQKNIGAEAEFRSLQRFSCSSMQLKKVGSSQLQLKKFGSSQLQLKKVGSSQLQLKKVGSSQLQLKKVGSSQLQLKKDD